MNLNEVDLQAVTGFPIVRGFLRIGTDSDMAALGITDHNYVLIEFPGWRTIGSPGTTIWPVIDRKRDAHGFCDVTLADIGVVFSALSPFDIGEVSHPGLGEKSFMRSGQGVGSLARCGIKANSGPLRPIESYELRAHYGAEGLKFAISGRFAVAERPSVAADVGGKAFSITAAIPWHTLTLKDFRFAGSYWKFGHSGVLPTKCDTPERQRDPRQLSDLLIAQGLNWPYVRGHLSFRPEAAWPRRRNGSVASFLSFQFGEYGPDSLIFSDAPRVEVLDNGFARCDGHTRSLTIEPLGRSRLELALLRQAALIMHLEGDALGQVRYQTGYAYEPSDPFGWIVQRIKSMSLHATLGNDGLLISAEGGLEDFDSQEFARHREQRNSELEPVRNYSLEASLPWAFLAARGLTFAYRARDF